MMKKIFLLAAILFCCKMFLHAQKIQYSRQTFQTPYADAMQLVANVSGYHHVVCFSSGKKPSIYIFDTQLQLQEQKEVDFKLTQNCDIRILKFSDFYLLYIHATGNTKHDLFRIDAQGNVNSLSKQFQQVVENELNKSNSTLQLVNQNEQLSIITHTYYDAIKKLGSSVVQLDSELKPVINRKVLYDFDKITESLQQSVLCGNNLLVLKLSRDDENGSSLHMIKLDFTTGQILTNSFNSSSHLYTSPSFSFNPKDSSILVHSIIREAIGSVRVQRNVFLCRLNYSLQQLSPVCLLPAQFRNNIATNYLLPEGAGLWLNMNNSIRLGRNSRATTLENFVTGDPSTLNIGRMNDIPSAYFTDYNQPTGVRFSVLDERLKIVKDSLIANDQRVLDVQPRPFAQFSSKNKNYLILVQNFSSDRRGLLMLSKTASGELHTEDIRVFDKYQYLLSQSQAVGDSYFILPYTHKKEIGLVKITPEN
jgi:hypothetical protein